MCKIQNKLNIILILKQNINVNSITQVVIWLLRYTWPLTKRWHSLNIIDTLLNLIFLYIKLILSKINLPNGRWREMNRSPTPSHPPKRKLEENTSKKLRFSLRAAVPDSVKGINETYSKEKLGKALKLKRKSVFKCFFQISKEFSIFNWNIFKVSFFTLKRNIL